MESPAPLVKSPSLLPRLGRWLRRGGQGLLDQLYPPCCLVCEAPLAGGQALCARCFAQLRPITPPYCPVLGLPFAAAIGPGAVSAQALADPPPFRRARSAVRYTEMAAALVGALKYGDRPELAGFCARLMLPAGRDFWEERPLLVPVPLHRSRQFRRRYNQSTELARALAALTGLAVDPLLASRRRPTRQQVGLSAEQRARNVANAFIAHPDALGRAAGRPVLLIDDVYTTGSTLMAVTRALHRAGIDHIDVLSFARVVMEVGNPI